MPVGGTGSGHDHSALRAAERYMSPAAVRYICRMGYDNKVFASALINMAVKRYIQVEESGRIYTLVRDQKDYSALTPEESAAGEILLPGGSTVLSQSNYARVGSAIQSLRGSLRSQFRNRYFDKHRIYCYPEYSSRSAAIYVGVQAMTDPPVYLLGFGVALVVTNVLFGQSAEDHITRRQGAPGSNRRIQDVHVRGGERSANAMNHLK